MPLDSYHHANNVKKKFFSKILIFSPFMGPYISKNGSKLRKQGFSKKIVKLYFWLNYLVQRFLNYLKEKIFFFENSKFQSFCGPIHFKKLLKIEKIGFFKKIIFINGLECPLLPEKPKILSKNDFRHYFEVYSKFGGVGIIFRPKIGLFLGHFTLRL